MATPHEVYCTNCTLTGPRSEFVDGKCFACYKYATSEAEAWRDKLLSTWTPKVLDKPREIKKATEMTEEVELPHEFSNDLAALQAAHELIHKQKCERISRSEDLKKLVMKQYGPALQKVGIDNVTFDVSEVPKPLNRGRQAIHALLLTSILVLCLTVAMPWYLLVLASVPFLLKARQMWSQYSAKELGRRLLNLNMSPNAYGQSYDYYYRKHKEDGLASAVWSELNFWTNYEAFEALAKHYTVEQVEARLQEVVKETQQQITKSFTPQQLEELEFATDLKLAQLADKKQQLALPPTTQKE